MYAEEAREYLLTRVQGICRAFSANLKEALAKADVNALRESFTPLTLWNTKNSNVVARHYVLVSNTEGWGQNYNQHAIAKIHAYMETATEASEIPKSWKGCKAFEEAVGTVLKYTFTGCEGVKLEQVDGRGLEFKIQALGKIGDFKNGGPIARVLSNAYKEPFFLMVTAWVA